MGNSLITCHLDSIKSVDNSITNLLFCPPNKNNRLDPSNLENNENHLYLKSKNGTKISTMEIWPNKKVDDNKMSHNKIIILSHGNGSDIYEMKTYCHELSDCYGVVVVIYDYPGYGLTMGDPSEKGCYMALETVINYYLKNADYNKYCVKKANEIVNIDGNIKSKDIVLIGQSLGTGITIDYISNHVWDGSCMVISAYKSIPRVLVDIPLEFAFKQNTFNSYMKMENVKCPVKIIHGKIDDLIPYHHSIDLFEKLPNKLFTPLYIENVGHNDILYAIPNEAFLQVLLYFK